MIKRIFCVISAVIILGISLVPALNIRSYADDDPLYYPQPFEGNPYYNIIEYKNVGYYLYWNSSNKINFDLQSNSYPYFIYGGYWKFFETYNDAYNALKNGDNIGFTLFNGRDVANTTWTVNLSNYETDENIVYTLYTNCTATTNLRYICNIPGLTKYYATNKNDYITKFGTQFVNIPSVLSHSYNITTHNCTADISNGTVGDGQDLTITFTPDNGYTFYGITTIITVSPAGNYSNFTMVSSPTYYGEGMTVKIIGITGDIDINVNAVEYFPITYDLENITLSNQTQFILKGQTYATTIVVEDGYNITDAFISMGGIDITSQAYDPETNTINAVSVQGQLVIRIIAELDPSGQLNNISLKLEEISSLIADVLGLQRDTKESVDEIVDILDGSYPEEDHTDDQSRIQEEISNYDDLETSLSDQAASNVDEVMDTSIDENVVQFMLDFQQGMSWLYDNELVIAGLGSCGVFMVIGFLLFGKKGHG